MKRVQYIEVVKHLQVNEIKANEEELPSKKLNDQTINSNN